MISLGLYLTNELVSGLYLISVHVLTAPSTGVTRPEPVHVRNYAFEVLNVSSEVTAAGAALRVGPRFWFR